MFETASPPAQPASRFLSASALAHAAAIVLLLVLRFPPPIRNLSSRAWRIALIAPLPTVAINRVNHAIPPPPAPPRIAREFHARTAIVLPTPAIVELAPVPAPETPRVIVPPVQLPAQLHATERVAPKPLPIGTFDDARAPVPHSSVLLVATAATRAFDPVSSSSVPAAARHAGQLGAFSDTTGAPAVSSHRDAIAGAGFGDSVVASSHVKAAPKSDPGSSSTPVEILSKPRPAYTAEARALQIEGEVLLEMQFGGSSEVRILRVVRGLGHGLDEAAVAAASGIRFRPARRNGVPLDSVAIVHIVFQLAY